MRKLDILLALALVLVVSCSEDNAPDNFEPRLFVGEAVDITRNEATVTGGVELRGSTLEPELGFVYGTDPGSMAMTAEAANAGDGMVAARLTGLKPGTTYYYRLQGNNGRVTLESDAGSFSTVSNGKPGITGLTVLSKGPASVIVGFDITDDGGGDIVEAGCYVMDTAEGVAEKVEAVMQSGASGIGCRLRIGGLKLMTEYTLQPYAVNDAGETRGECLSFSTSNAVETSEPGELASLIGEDKYGFTEMTFAGPMDGDDIRLLRQMMGRDVDGSATPGRLARVDLTDVCIVAGGGSYDKSRYTENDVVGYGMFAYCDLLEDVSLPATAKRIVKDAFLGCSSLERLVIPAEVDEVSVSGGCAGLKELEVSPANQHYKSVDGVLFNADVSRIVWFPIGKQGDYELPGTVESVGDYAFSGCSITRFTLPGGVKQIGQGAFYASMVEEVVLSDGIRLVPTGAFQDCRQLRSVTLGAGTELVSDYVFDGCPLEHLYVKASLPPVCDGAAFSNTQADLFSACTLHVPQGSVMMYKYDPDWGCFDNIVGF